MLEGPISDPKWICRFLEAAEHRSTFSKDPSTKVGAVVVAPDGKSDVSYGYNGYPAGIPDVHMNDREYKYPRTLHAEINSILAAKRDLHDHILFTTLAPCAPCAAVIIQSGIQAVYHIQEIFESNDRWIDSHNIALDMFDYAGVSCYGVSRGIELELIDIHEQQDRIKLRHL